MSREIAEADENLLQNHLASSQTIAEADADSIGMHHIHLPKLEEYGFIEWDKDDDVVTQGPVLTKSGLLSDCWLNSRMDAVRKVLS